VWLVCFFSCISSLHAEPLRVRVVLSEEGGAYREFSDALREELKTYPVILNVGEAVETADDSDLTIAVGMSAASALATSTKPVLSVLVPKAGYDKLAKPVAAIHSSAIYIDQPIERQISLLVAAMPKVKRIGVLYSAFHPELTSLRRTLAERNILLFEEAVGQEHPLHDALEEVLGESEVLLVLPDTEIYNAGTIRNILLSSYRKQVPLIGISKSYVKAGALCAIYSTPKQIVIQTVEAVKQYISTGKLPSSQYPKDFEVSVNMQVARSLDLPVKDADKLRDEVRKAP